MQLPMKKTVLVGVQDMLEVMSILFARYHGSLEYSEHTAGNILVYTHKSINLTLSKESITKTIRQTTQTNLQT